MTKLREVRMDMTRQIVTLKTRKIRDMAA